MSSKPKIDGAQMIEDAHWRMDEHERALDEIKRGLSPEVVAAIVQGAVSVLHTKLMETVQQKYTDMEKLLEGFRGEVSDNKELACAVRELVAKLGPKTKTATLNLPSGPVTVTIQES